MESIDYFKRYFDLNINFENVELILRQDCIDINSKGILNQKNRWDSNLTFFPYARFEI